MGTFFRARSWARACWRVVRWLLVVYLAVLLLLMFFEESLIFFPSGPGVGNWQPWGLPIEDAQFQAADGTRLHGWYVRHEHPRAVVLFCHGNAGNITHRADVLRNLHGRVGASVLVFDYRGYGRSEGKPNEAGVLADARAARAWLAQREKLAESQIVLMGESLGGAVAVDLAAADGARALVLQSTFTSVADIAAHYYSWFPVRWLMRTRFDSVAKIANYRGPLLQSHGIHDEIIPFQFGQRLYDAANRPKRLFPMPDRLHNDPPPPEYYDTLAEFLDQAAREDAAADTAKTGVQGGPQGRR